VWHFSRSSMSLQSCDSASFHTATNRNKMSTLVHKCEYHWITQISCAVLSACLSL
jgi:hypothetical protein